MIIPKLLYISFNGLLIILRLIKILLIIPSFLSKIITPYVLIREFVKKGIITKVIMISLTFFFLEDRNIQKGYDIKIEKRVVTNAIIKDFKNIFIYTKSKRSL